MSNRFTDSEKWRDPWFHRLNHKSKLVFLYLCDTCDIAGFWEIDEERCAYETGIDKKSIPACLETLGDKIVFNGHYLWLRNFIKRQKNVPLSGTNNAHKGIIKRLEHFRGLSDTIDVLLAGGNPYLSPCCGASEPLTRGTGKGKGKGKGKGSSKSNVVEKEFEEQFWPNVPNKIGKGKTREAFVKARKDVELAVILAGLPTYQAYEAKRKAQDGDDFRPLHPSTWLNQERYADEPVGGVATRSPEAGVVWDKVLPQLKEELGETQFGTWFENPVPVRLSDNELVIAVTDAFTKGGIDRRFAGAIEKLLTEIQGHEMKLKVEEGE